MIWALLLAAILILGWKFLTHVYSHWERKGFPYVQPKIPFGNLDSVRRREKSFGMAICEIYEKSEAPFVGIYLLYRPAVLIRDAQLAKSILTTEFNHFHDRGIYVDDEKDPISGNLFALQGQKWKTLRSKLTPLFTSGKLKNMFPTIDATGKTMYEYLNSILPDDPRDGAVVELKDLMSRYAVDIIGSVIFGLDVNSFKFPENEFRALGDKINDRGIVNTIRNLSTFLCPKLIDVLRFFRVPEEATDGMRKIVQKTIEFREKNHFMRKDLMQLLLQLRNTGKINLDDNIWDVETAAESLKSMSIDQIAAQAFLFYIAGFETSASTTAFCLYELSQNPEVLVKVQEDINNALQLHDGILTFDAIQSMKYLELCILETVRKYPGLPMLNRECTSDFNIPGTNYTIEKGTAVLISVMGMHRDPKYFRDPLSFIPERFIESEKDFNAAAYMPFGEGPRHCIASRMGKITAKVGIATILTNFNIEATEKKEIEFDNYAVVIMPKGGVNVKMSKKVNKM